MNDNRCHNNKSRDRMTEEDLSEFFGDALIKDKVERLWHKVMESSRKFINDSKKFGFQGIEILPNPNVHQMLRSLRLADGAFEILMADADDADLDTHDFRLIFNAKQQILHMERVATALKNKDQIGYDEAVLLLERQASF